MTTGETPHTLTAETLPTRVRLITEAIRQAMEAPSRRFEVHAPGGPGRDPGTLVDEFVDIRVDDDVDGGLLVEVGPRLGPKPQLAVRPVGLTDQASVSAFVLDIAQMFEGSGSAPDAPWRVQPVTEPNPQPVDEDWLEHPNGADLWNRLERLARSRAGTVVIRLAVIGGPRAELTAHGSAAQLDVRAQIAPQVARKPPPPGWHLGTGRWRRSWRLAVGSESARAVLDDTLAALAFDADVPHGDERRALALRFESNAAFRRWQSDRTGCVPLVLAGIFGPIAGWIVLALHLYPDTGMLADGARSTAGQPAVLRDGGGGAMLVVVAVAAALLVAYLTTRGLGRLIDRTGLGVGMGTALTNTVATVSFVAYFAAILTTPSWPWLIGLPLAPIAIVFGLGLLMAYRTEAIVKTSRGGPPRT